MPKSREKYPRLHSLGGDEEGQIKNKNRKESNEI